MLPHPMNTGSRLKSLAIVGGIALAGWAYCGAIMGILPPIVGMDTALLVHLTGAPLGFAALAFVYHRRWPHYPALTTAAAFVAIVMVLDALLVAPIFLGSFEMFRSVIGTWLPFALIFLASWGTGVWALRRPSR